MSRIPVFSAHEIEAAFRLILPAADAESASRDWIDMFVDESDIDEDGMILLDEAEWRNAASAPIVSLPSYGRELDVEDFQTWSTARKRKFLMRLSDFTLNLLALSSNEVFERVRMLRGDSLELAAHRARQTQRIVSALAP